MTTQVQPAQTSFTNGPDLAPAKAANVPDAVTLGSAHLYGVVAQALVDRGETLKKLAKDAAAEGYAREANAISADAAAIELVLLPRFRMQRELPLVDAQKFEEACSHALSGLVRAAFAGLDEPKTKVTKDAIARRASGLVRDLGVRVAAFARDIADASYVHGYQVRTKTPDVIAAAQLRTLAGGRAD